MKLNGFVFNAEQLLTIKGDSQRPTTYVFGYVKTGVVSLLL